MNNVDLRKHCEKARSHCKSQLKVYDNDREMYNFFCGCICVYRDILERLEDE